MKAEWRRALHLNWLLDLATKSVDGYDPKVYKGVARDSLTGLTEFKGATYLFAQGDDEVDLYFNDVTWDCLAPGFDSSICFVGVTSGECPIVFSRIRQMSVRELRGVPFTSDKVVMLYRMGIDGQTRFCSKKIFEYLPNGTWRHLRSDTNAGWRRLPNGARIKDADNTEAYTEEVHHLSINFSAAFSDQYQWKVEFTNSSGFSIKVACHPKNIAKMFKLREKYADRRKSLRHLVTQHWRKLDTDEVFNLETFVRDHLRGKLQFKWYDLQCRIIIPTSLKTDLTKKKLQRALMSVETPRTDRRYRLASAAR